MFGYIHVPQRRVADRQQDSVCAEIAFIFLTVSSAAFPASAASGFDVQAGKWNPKEILA